VVVDTLEVPTHHHITNLSAYGWRMSQWDTRGATHDYTLYHSFRSGRTTISFELKPNYKMNYKRPPHTKIKYKSGVHPLPLNWVIV
jgi:hypothetical protein